MFCHVKEMDILVKRYISRSYLWHDKIHTVKQDIRKCLGRGLQFKVKKLRNC